MKNTIEHSSAACARMKKTINLQCTYTSPKGALDETFCHSFPGTFLFLSPIHPASHSAIYKQPRQTPYRKP